MTKNAEISDDISRRVDQLAGRVDQLAARSNLTRAQIIEGALAHGRSLAWQERWIAGVEAGLKDAEASNFASDDEIASVLNRYGAA